MPKRKAMFGTMLHYNRVLHLSDYQIFGAKYRKDWEIAMALKTLRELGAAHPGANLLGAGAGKEPTIYHLANAQDANWVWATDLYKNMGVWGEFGLEFLHNPAQFAPPDIEFDSIRIVPEHVDMTNMPFLDDRFDGVFSCGSIEHVGTNGAPNYDAIRTAAREIGRVVKPGGIISLSTEWKLAGEGWGFDNVVLFDKDLLMKYIVEPSGCELVDEPDWTFDGDFDDAVELSQRVAGYMPDVEYVLREGQFVFTSIHLALKKG